MGFQMASVSEMESTEQNDIRFMKARAELGLNSFGLQLEEFPQNTGEDAYQEHSHAKDGQDEVYLCLSGTGEIQVDDQDWTQFGPGTFIKVDPESTRKFRTEQGMQLLAISAPQDSGYQPQSWTEKGDPSSSSTSGQQQEEQGDEQEQSS